MLDGGETTKQKSVLNSSCPISRGRFGKLSEAGGCSDTHWRACGSSENTNTCLFSMFPSENKTLESHSGWKWMHLVNLSLGDLALSLQHRLPTAPFLKAFSGSSCCEQKPLGRVAKTQLVALPLQALSCRDSSSVSQSLKETSAWMKGSLARSTTLLCLPLSWRVSNLLSMACTGKCQDTVGEQTKPPCILPFGKISTVLFKSVSSHF